MMPIRGPLQGGLHAGEWSGDRAAGPGRIALRDAIVI